MIKLQTVGKAAMTIVLAGLLLWWWLPEQKNQQIKYHTQEVTQGKIESTVNSSGSISPVVTVDVGSELSGLISQLNVDFNDVVTSGQVIARIDDRTVQSKLRQSEADLASTRASLVQLQAGLNKAQTQAKLAEREYIRSKELHTKKLVSESVLDTNETANELAKVNIETAKAAILVGEARVQQSLSSLDQAKLNIDRTYIRSPVDGVVIDRKVDKGQAVSASLSAPTLFSIAQDLVSMQIETDVDEADIGRIKQEQPVKFTVDAYPERKFSGIVTQVRKSATVTNNVVTYKVIIGLENRNLLLLPGMTANVDIILGQRDDVLRASNSALRFTPEGQSTGGQGGGRDPSGKIEQMAEQLKLNAEQQKKLGEVLAKVQTKMVAAREASRGQGGGGGGRPSGGNDAMKKIRSQLDIELRSFLSPEQIKQYQSLNQRRRKPRGDKGGKDSFQRGTVWVLRDGQPKRINVRVGIADLEYSEIQSDELKAGDLVIVRAQKVSS
jgi:HlyD family secretion protein